MAPSDWLKNILIRIRNRSNTDVSLPPAPRTLDDDAVIFDDDKMLREVNKAQTVDSSLPDGRKVPPLRGKTGTVTGIPAYCPNCNNGKNDLTQTSHQLIGYSAGFAKARVKCTVCKHEHDVPFAPKVQ